MSEPASKKRKMPASAGGRHALTVRRVGNSCGLVLPKQVMDDLGVAEGDRLFAVRTPDGIRLTPYDPEFVDAVESARRFMRRHRNAMRELARR